VQSSLDDRSALVTAAAAVVVLGLPIPKGLPVSIHERARTSPIWYTPAT
jgi:hypothetical protein